MSSHRTALITIAAAVAVAGLLGLIDSAAQPHWPLWHSEFCALANAVTDGCDVPPRRNGYVVTMLEYLLVVPLFAAAISLFTSALTAAHVHAAKDEIKKHIERNMG